MDHSSFIVPPHRKIKLADYDPAFTDGFSCKDDAKEKLRGDIRKLAEYQDVLYAQNTYALLIILQAMDAAGKDGTIKHVMSGVNPQGCQVFGFKVPSAEELDHDYLWRYMKALPERGRIGIFNRSYFEEVLVARVHHEVLAKQQLPDEAKGKDIWERRFREINNFEEYLVRNGIVVLKFFLNVSKREQKRRFLERIDTPEKNWKFSFNDVKERKHWDDYMKVYEEMFNATSTELAPWYIIPADHKWFTRAAVSNVIIHTMEKLNLRYPDVSDEHKLMLREAREVLDGEG